MSLNRTALLQSIVDALPTPSNRALTQGPIITAELVHDALHAMLTVQSGRDQSSDALTLDALCRQIDVRKKLAHDYGPNFAKAPNETVADSSVVIAVVALLLIHASALQDANDTTGRAVKYINSAAKALDFETTSHAPALRGWAIELLDTHAQGAAA